jgi:hypothetical protein
MWNVFCLQYTCTSAIHLRWKPCQRRCLRNHQENRPMAGLIQARANAEGMNLRVRKQGRSTGIAGHSSGLQCFCRRSHFNLSFGRSSGTRKMRLCLSYFFGCSLSICFSCSSIAGWVVAADRRIRLTRSAISSRSTSRRDTESACSMLLRQFHATSTFEQIGDSAPVAKHHAVAQPFHQEQRIPFAKADRSRSVL